jgi:NAD(P)H dehydrogenase (quinone)
VNILLVLDHPVRASFCGALADAVNDGARAAGHRIDFLDLARADFDCQFQPADHAYFLGGPVPRDVAAMHRRVEAADALVFVYPVYWWTVPARTRGWIDRVLTAGWAYAMEPQGNRPLLRDRPFALVASAGAGRQTIEDFGYGPAMRRLIDEGTFGYCGLTTMHQVLVPDVHESAEARATGLAAARALPQRMFAS